MPYEFIVITDPLLQRDVVLRVSSIVAIIREDISRIRSDDGPAILYRFQIHCNKNSVGVSPYNICCVSEEQRTLLIQKILSVVPEEKIFYAKL